jgi:hypothetical protein
LTLQSRRASSERRTGAHRRWNQVTTEDDNAGERRDEVLKRMLRTPPKPHKDEPKKRAPPKPAKDQDGSDS